MGKILTVAIHKGGTGKTTLVSHLALYCLSVEKSVLVVDMDAQGNISSFFNSKPTEQGTSKLFFENSSIGPQKSLYENLHIIPADEGLFGVERLPFEAASTFKIQLKKFARNYDVIIIDTPPTMGFSMLAPLIASDFVVAPVIPDAYSVKGVRSLFSKIKAVKSKQNTSLNFLGLVINRWNSRNSQQCQMVKQFQENLPKQLISQILGDRSAIANAAYEGKAVWDKPSGGAARIAANEMLAVAREIMQKMEIVK
ncbi:MAG: ParA family protein [Thiolinea sp.]